MTVDMSLSNINIPTNSSLFVVDTREGPNKVLFLPPASTVSGRYITLKDYYGFAGSSTFYISTTGVDRIDLYNSSITVSTSFQSFGFLSDGISNWATLANQTGPIPTAFLPSDISNPDIWFDAAYLPNLTFDSTTCNITGWSNRGSIAVLAESNAGYIPPKLYQTTQNGLNVVTYGASANLFIETMTLPYGERTCFAVFKQNQLTGPGKSITFLQQNNGYNFGDFSFLIGYDGGNGSNFVATVNGGYCFPMFVNIPQNLTNYVMVSLIATFSDTGQQGIWYNGSNATTTWACPSENNAIDATYSLGGGTQDVAVSYEYAESIIFQSILSVADRERVEGYLVWKWGLRNLLPAEHPYKNAAP
jgi:hypothetical protein